MAGFVRALPWIALIILALIVMAKKTVFDPIIIKMAEAIKTFEGWYPGSISYQNNNPGNLKFAGQAGAIGKDRFGHAIFESYDAGWSALLRQIWLALTWPAEIYSPVMTLRQFFSKYAEENSEQYAVFVAGRLGVSPDTRLEDLL